ncbi:MAG: hypothetical protein KC619_03420 [Myxococcales bacterium]|nr:hypothetical protein [Myxococcales bacterium]
MLVAVVVLVVERVRALSYVSNVDLPVLRKGVRRLLERGEPDRAARLLAAAEPAWAPHCALPLLDPALDDAERIEIMEDRLADARMASLRGMRTLRGAATIASALGFIGAAIEIHWVFNGDHGILGLEAGRIENIGLAKALLSIAIGIATSSFAIGSFTVLRKIAIQRVTECRRLVGAVEDALGPLNEGDRVVES